MEHWVVPVLLSAGAVGITAVLLYWRSMQGSEKTGISTDKNEPPKSTTEVATPSTTSSTTVTSCVSAVHSQNDTQEPATSSSSSSSSIEAAPQFVVSEAKAKEPEVKPPSTAGRPSIVDVFAAGGIDITEPAAPTIAPGVSASDTGSSSVSPSEDSSSSDETAYLSKLARETSLSTESGDESYSGDSNSESGSESERSESDSDSGSSSDEGLVKDFYGITEGNIAGERLTCYVVDSSGLKRAKKKSVVTSVYQNEDTMVTACPLDGDSDVGLFCVFDGHGGKECSEELTTVFPDAFYEWFIRKNGYAKKDLREVWEKAYKMTEDYLFETKNYDFQGSTATTAVIWTQNSRNIYLQVANLGDSTAFLWDGQSCRQLTMDHKPTTQSERDRIKAMGVELGENQTRIEGGLAVSRAFGDFECKVGHVTGMIGQPEITEAIHINTNKSNKLIIASDGLWDVISGEVAFDIIANCKKAKEAAKKLIGTAVQSKKCADNVTVIVVFL